MTARRRGDSRSVRDRRTPRGGRSPRRRPRGGLALAEVLVALLLLSLVAAATAVEVRRTVARQEAFVAARAFAGDVVRRRSEAVGRARHLGLVFSRDEAGQWSVTLHEDGDGDGIRADDVAAGRDPAQDRTEPFHVRYGGARPGFLPDLPRLRSPPPVSRPLPSLEDPVRFGSSDTVSFTPRGRVAAGTLYVTDGLERQLAVVVHGTVGRASIWEYDPEAELWRAR